MSPSISSDMSIPNHRQALDAGISHGSIAVEGGPSVTLWSLTGRTAEDPLATMRFQLQPEECAVIGRAEGGEVPYLDPRFTPTQIVPSTGQSVLTQGGTGTDLSVSRGHFMLRGVNFGLVLINGVPRRGGGIRPPINGTVRLAPQYRWMAPEEEFWIKPGKDVRIRLPNSTVIAIRAE
ncbi:MAG: hypothetical protein FJ271_23525 [Planctomycetes bacterium]|nr:hypothetical protein [Planctomycetota bacterium]